MAEESPRRRDLVKIMSDNHLDDVCHPLRSKKDNISQAWCVVVEENDTNAMDKGESTTHLYLGAELTLLSKGVPTCRDKQGQGHKKRRTD
jgi:hypothetical protein